MHNGTEHGKSGAWRLVDGSCPKCSKPTLVCLKWESDDGAYEEYKYRCQVCGHTWWVEGPDA